MVDSAPMISDTINKQISNIHHRNTNKQDSLHNLKVYHQNVRGLKDKLNLLSNFFYSEFIHIICLTEHHLKDHEINLVSMEHYKLSSKFCRQQYKNGGTCIYVNKSIDYDIIPTDHICNEKDLETCAIKLNLHKINIVIISIYRSPSGNYSYFLKKLESFFKSLYTLRTEYIICGDINVNYLHSNSRQQQLDMLLTTYNLVGIVKFPTRITKQSSTTIDNFFIDPSRKHSIKPIANGISDHDAQILVLENVLMPAHKLTPCVFRDFNDHSIYNFLMHLSMENWDDVFSENNVNIFNKFVDTYLKIFNTHFKQTKYHPLQKINP